MKETYKEDYLSDYVYIYIYIYVPWSSRLAVSNSVTPWTVAC